MFSGQPVHCYPYTHYVHPCQLIGQYYSMTVLSLFIYSQIIANTLHQPYIHPEPSTYWPIAKP